MHQTFVEPLVNLQVLKLSPTSRTSKFLVLNILHSLVSAFKFRPICYLCPQRDREIGISQLSQKVTHSHNSGPSVESDKLVLLVKSEKWETGSLKQTSQKQWGCMFTERIVSLFDVNLMELSLRHKPHFPLLFDWPAPFIFFLFLLLCVSFSLSLGCRLKLVPFHGSPSWRH